MEITDGKGRRAAFNPQDIVLLERYEMNESWNDDKDEYKWVVEATVGENGYLTLYYKTKEEADATFALILGE